MSNIDEVIERLTDYNKGKAKYKTYQEFRDDMRTLLVYATLQIRINQERERWEAEKAGPWEWQDEV